MDISLTYRRTRQIHIYRDYFLKISFFFSGSLCSPVPGPLPLGVSVVDRSISVFGLIFPRVALKHRLQMLQHFSEHIKQAQGNKSSKSASTGEAIQINIFTALLSSLKCLVEAKAKLGSEEVKKAAADLIMGEC